MQMLKETIESLNGNTTEQTTTIKNYVIKIEQLNKTIVVLKEKLGEAAVTLQSNSDTMAYLNRQLNEA